MKHALLTFRSSFSGAWLAVLLSVLILTAAPNAVSAQQLEPVRVVVFGDSLTAGYQIAQEKSFAPMLQQKLLSEGFQVNVINLSVSGETSAGGAARLQELLATNPDIVMLQLGTNDALRQIDPKKMLYPNLHKIMHALKERNVGMVLMGAQPPTTVSASYARDFTYILAKLAKMYGATYYPDALKGVSGRADLTLADGLHPNESGVLAMVHGVYRYVKPLVKWRIDLQKYKNSTK